MEFLTLNNKKKRCKNLKKYLIDWDAVSRSKLQKKVKDFICKYWSNNIVFEELANFAGDLLGNPAEALSSLGSDMTDDQREKAQEVIIPVIVVSQVMNAVAQVLSARRI